MMFVSEHEAVKRARRGDVVVPVIKSRGMINGRRECAIGYKVTRSRDQIRSVFLPDFRNHEALDCVIDDVLRMDSPKVLNKETFESIYNRHNRPHVDDRDFLADRSACDAVIDDWFSGCDLSMFQLVK